MNLEPVMQSEETQKEKKQMLYINTYIWNLRKQYWWAYFQGRNRESDIENRLTDIEGAGESGPNWESSIEIYTLPHVEQAANGKLLYNTRSST